jgi:hypothetical protein
MASHFWRLKKKDYFMMALELQKRMPELNYVNSDIIVDRLRGSGITFYEQESVPSPLWLRLTLPFGLIAMLVLFLLLPVNYMICGRWGYKWEWLINWFRALGFFN